jgi:hypothetical protein
MELQMAKKQNLRRVFARSREGEIRRLEEALERAREAQRRELSPWRAPITVAVVSVVLGLFGNIFLAYRNAQDARDLAQQQAENNRITQLISAAEPEQTEVNLKFLIDSGLISDAAIIESIQAYYRDRDGKTGPGRSPAAGTPVEYFSEFEAFFNAYGLEYINAVEMLFLGASNENPASAAYQLNHLPPRALWPNLVELATVLDEFRRRYGAPIFIVSAYRAPDYNASLFGSQQLLHTQGLAADFVSINGTPEEWAAILREMRDEGLFAGGIEVHPNFVHVDLGGINAELRQD